MKAAKEKKPIDYSKVPPDVWDKEWLDFVLTITNINATLPRLQKDLAILEKIYESLEN